jgi:hypothetical protein
VRSVTTIRGAEAHKRRLRKLRGAAMIRPVTQAVFASAQDLAVDASLSITKGSVSGKGHVASDPGEPPNADTQVLSRNIEAVSTGPLKAETSSNAPCAAAQEFGSEKQNLPERPYMRPAATRERPKAGKRIVDAVNKVIRNSGA